MGGIRTSVSLVICTFIALTLGSAARVHAAPPATSKPKLVLMITVDQLRGDMPLRFHDRLRGGLRQIMDRGVHFTNAHYRHNTTFTAVGHATLATGGGGATHGMAGNNWYNAEDQRQVYCVEDDRHTILGRSTKDHEGTSPRNLSSSTFGDELVAATAGGSRVFSVSAKDRGAILPGGHLGKAFWYDSGHGRFVTSSYYYDRYPSWVDAWNAKRLPDSYRGATWNLLYPRKDYLFKDQDDRAYEKGYKALGRTFPHKLDAEKDSDFYKMLRFTPMGDELTAAFAIELLTREKLGQGAHTDVLCVSFSCTDYIGHAFGPNSLEAEDNLMRIDRTIAMLLAVVDGLVGLDNTLIALSSDHGVDAAPEYRHDLMCAVRRAATKNAKQTGWQPRTPGQTLLMRIRQKGGAPLLCCSAGRHDPNGFKQKVNAALKRRFYTDRDLVLEFFNPSIYLDQKVIDELHLDVAEVEAEAARVMADVPGIAFAVTRTDLLAGRVTDTPIMRKVQRGFHPKRTGNVVIVQDPFWYLYSDMNLNAAMHGSPWTYDTHVPVILAAPGLNPRRVSRDIGPDDIAPTICQYLGIPFPSGNLGQPLPELLSTAAPAHAE